LESKQQIRETKESDLELKEEEVEEGDVLERIMRFLKSMKDTKIEISYYGGNLTTLELIDPLGELDRYFGPEWM
jgi:hypothetical protein